MLNDNDSSGSNTATASSTAGTIRRYNERDEAEFLRQQSQDAKRAMRQTLAAMQETVSKAADAQAWTREYPWPSVGTAALAGFMASSLLPSLLGRTDGTQTDGSPPSWSSLMAFVKSSLFGAIRSAVIRAITDAVQAHEPPCPTDSDELTGV